MAVLYPDPVTGFPPQYARDHIPPITEYPEGQTAPPMTGVNFTPGELLGCVSGELGLRQFLEAGGHELVVTSDMCVREPPDDEHEPKIAVCVFDIRNY